MKPSKLDVYAQEVRTSVAHLKRRIALLSDHVHAIHGQVSEAGTLEGPHADALGQIKQEVTELNGLCSSIGNVPVPLREPVTLVERDPADAYASQEDIDRGVESSKKRDELLAERQKAADQRETERLERETDPGRVPERSELAPEREIAAV